MDLLAASQCLFHGRLFSVKAVVWISKVLKSLSHQDSVWTQVEEVDFFLPLHYKYCTMYV